jgi:hypothetical protein
MARIRCFYEDCVFLVKGFCSAQTIELDPEDGCLTYSEDPGDMTMSLLHEDEDEEFEESWEDEGFEEIDDSELSESEF